tara:strand:- start:920 stop:1957 length:1038 start_codon:yes stop_codon:yes gene_type:complete
MKILVTGNNGYIGSVLVKKLLDKGYDVVGYDIDYFKECNLEPINELYPTLVKDIRDIDYDDLKGIDSIIHLAGLSNDPLGEFDSAITKQINYSGTIKLGQLAKEAGVDRFVYASSQSMYGVSDLDEELDEENSKKNPVTAYAETKWQAELSLKKLNSNDFTVTCFRPSTVFGVSPRLRCDVVFNNLVACAYTTGTIEILSDGSPWRPVVHVNDVCKAFISGIEAPSDIVSGESFNVGIPNGNFTVKELAEAAKKCVPGSRLIFKNQHTDPRTYKVSFTKILNKLNNYYKPSWDLIRGGKDLVSYFDKVSFTKDDFRGAKCNRLLQLKRLIKNNIITVNSLEKKEK